MRRILHPTDFSPASSAAFTQAVTLAKRHGAELVIAHVLAPTLPSVDRYVGQQIYDQIETARRHYGRKHLDLLVSRGARWACALVPCSSTEWRTIGSCAPPERSAPP